MKRCAARARKMLSDLRASNPKASAAVIDPAPHVSVICPRRAGKTYMGVLAALITGEAKPGSISLIISLNKKQLKRLYWAGAPSGIHTLARKYGLNLEYNGTDLRWEHENGSFGYLLGADDDDQLEVIRGLEADLYLIDECKSFAPQVLDTLIDDIIDPQRSSRRGRLFLIGTPGYILDGPFYRATCPAARDADGKPYLLGIASDYTRTDNTVDSWGRTPVADLLWSCHAWTLEDNRALPHQWTDALTKKRAMGWADNHPTWSREFLGHWTTSSSGLVFRYYAEKQLGRVTWTPERTKQNPTGLPEAGAPWHLVGGLDLGYEAPTAFVVCAYSTRLRQFRHVADYSQRHCLPTDIAAMIQGAIDEFGPIEKIYADIGNLGKMIVTQLTREYGFPLEFADKREKYDHIELLNAGFVSGEVQVIANTPLEYQLLTNAWNFRSHARAETDDKAREQLARSGKLKEDDTIPNDSTDAFLYCYRGSLHHFGNPRATSSEPLEGSAEWVVRWEKAQLAKVRAEYQMAAKADKRLGDNRMSRAPAFVKRALIRNSGVPRERY